MAKEKIVLAYSGGLDTSVILTWLKETYDAEIIAVCIDIGQEEDYRRLERKAYNTGASKAYIIDSTEEFITDYIWPTLKCGAAYEKDYLLGTSFARPLMAKILVDIANKENSKIIAHGCTGKGNDQVRFESSIHSLDPNIEIIAPWRSWNINSREDLIEYANSHNIPIDQNFKKIYSRDQNIWHISHEGGNLEDPWNEHEEDINMMSVNPEHAPDMPTNIQLEFFKGVPIALNGKNLNPLEMMVALNKLGGDNGIGTIDIIENRLVGMKSRGVYETPGGTILYAAHDSLEKLVLDRDTMNFKTQIGLKYAQLVYAGLWFTPLKTALDSFVDSIEEKVTGTVKLKLYKGNVIYLGGKSPYSLFNADFATFGEDSVYNQGDATGFINLFSLSMKIRALANFKEEQTNV